MVLGAFGSEGRSSPVFCELSALRFIAQAVKSYVQAPMDDNRQGQHKLRAEALANNPTAWLVTTETGWREFPFLEPPMEFLFWLAMIPVSYSIIFNLLRRGLGCKNVRSILGAPRKQDELDLNCLLGSSMSPYDKNIIYIYMYVYIYIYIHIYMYI